MSKILYIAPVFSDKHIKLVNRCFEKEKVTFISRKELISNSNSNIVFADYALPEHEQILLAKHFHKYMNTIDLSYSAEGLINAYSDLSFESFILPLFEFIL